MDGKVSAVEEVASGIRRVTFSFEKRFNFVPGQYVWVEIQNDRRAFSICSAPNDENDISIIARISDSKYKQNLFNLKAGDDVIIHGPFGSLRFPENPKVPVICVAGGVGIAPFLSLIPDSLANFPKRKITFIYASKSEKEAVPLPFPSIKIIGKITKDVLERESTKLPTANWYVIGPQGFVDATYSYLEDLNLDLEKVSFEEHYPSLGYKSLEAKDLEAYSIDNLFKIAVDKAFVHFIITDINGHVIYANKAAENITGYTFEEMIGNTPRLWGGLMDRSFYKSLWFNIKDQHQPFFGEITNRRKNGEIYMARTTISPITNKDGVVVGFLGTEEDVTEFVQKTNELERFNKLIMGRELKMIELKKEMEELKKKLNKNV